MLRSAAVFVVLCLAQSAGSVTLAQTPAQDTPTESAREPMSEPPSEVQPEDPPPVEEMPGDEDEISLGEIPEIATVELEIDTARRAVETFVMMREKYAEANFEDYESLQDFVDKDALGKTFEADVKAAGFSDVTQWNTAITSVGFAYSAVTDDQSEDIRLQIEEVKADTTIAQDMKDKMVSSLNAMIPSENNRKVVGELMNEPGMADKLKLLDEVAE